MDKKLEQALEFSNFRLILSTKQENIKMLFNNKLIITYETGSFKIDTNLLVLVIELINLGRKDFIFIDLNNIPIQILDLNDFWDKIFSQYNKAINQYYKEYQNISKARDIKKVIDF